MEPQVGKPAQVTQEDEELVALREFTKFDPVALEVVGGGGISKVGGQLGKVATAALRGRGGVVGFPKGTKFTSTGIPIRDQPNATIVGHIVEHPRSGEEIVFAAKSGWEALALAQSLGVKVKTAYRVK